MTGVPEDPLTMLDDVTSEPLEQVVSTEEFFRQIRSYDAIRAEMWPHFISFRYAVDGDVAEEVAKGTLLHLLSNVIAHQAPVSVRVVAANGSVRTVIKERRASRCGGEKEIKKEEGDKDRDGEGDGRDSGSNGESL
jgi:hypothetical protein